MTLWIGSFFDLTPQEGTCFMSHEGHLPKALNLEGRGNNGCTLSAGARSCGKVYVPSLVRSVQNGIEQTLRKIAAAPVMRVAALDQR